MGIGIGISTALIKDVLDSESESLDFFFAMGIGTGIGTAFQNDGEPRETASETETAPQP